MSFTHAFQSFQGKISTAITNIQHLTAIQPFHSDLLPTLNCYFQFLTAISTFNCDSYFKVTVKHLPN